MPGLGASFGRGGATTNLMDLANSDCIVIMGSSMAENHPVGFRFVMQAKERGARVVHIDPRFSRTSALSDLHVPIRSGTDIAFLGGLINYVLEEQKYFREYVLAYTNAATLIADDFRDTEDLDGLFSGYDEKARQYRIDSWQYRGADTSRLREIKAEKVLAPEAFSEFVAQRAANAPRDETLQDPRCVLQILRRHYARYTPEMVAKTCGVPEDTFLKVARWLTDNSGRDRTTAFCYAVGWTQHTTGVQMIRAAAILQSLLGNIGRPGGGVMALRGHATIQGSTDIPTLYDMLPGYLAMKNAKKRHATLTDYIAFEQAETGWWHELPKYIVSLLNAYYGNAATKANDFRYGNLPTITTDHSQLPMTLAIADGKIKGLFVLGQNPAAGGHNTRLVRNALPKLDWLVVRDFFETDTAAFWYASPEARSGELDPRQIKTEIFLMPAAATAEKDGSYTNTMRLVQYHHKAVEPPGDSRSEVWFIHHLAQRLKRLYAKSTAERDRPIREITFDYTVKGPHEEPVVEEIVKEINGYTVAGHKPVATAQELKDDGSTACGCWIYTGVYPEEGRNVADSREPDPPGTQGANLGWGFAWPANRRILYNRASADPSGRPWSERKRYVWWDAAGKKWTGIDTPDFPPQKAPDYRPKPGARGMDAHSGASPFMLMPDGVAWLFAPAGVNDGPMPTHYEAVESPVPSPLHARRSRSPVFKDWERKGNEYAPIGDTRFPYVLTTYRLTEQHCAGLMSRAVPWLSELQPQPFVEIGEALAAEKGIRNGAWVTLSSARGEIEVRALVTSRLAPLRLDGTVVHQLALPWHFGYMAYAKGDVANDLTSIAGEPNVSIHEGKTLTCDIRPGRKR